MQVKFFGGGVHPLSVQVEYMGSSGMKVSLHLTVTFSPSVVKLYSKRPFNGGMGSPQSAKEKKEYV